MGEKLWVKVMISYIPLSGTTRPNSTFPACVLRTFPHCKLGLQSCTDSVGNETVLLGSNKYTWSEGTHVKVAWKQQRKNMDFGV